MYPAAPIVVNNGFFPQQVPIPPAGGMFLPGGSGPHHSQSMPNFQTHYNSGQNGTFTNGGYGGAAANSEMALVQHQFDPGPGLELNDAETNDDLMGYFDL